MKTLILGNGLIAKGIARKLVSNDQDVIIVSRNIEDKIENVSYQKQFLEEIVGNRNNLNYLSGQLNGEYLSGCL